MVVPTRNRKQTSPCQHKSKRSTAVHSKRSAPVHLLLFIIVVTFPMQTCAQCASIITTTGGTLYTDVTRYNTYQFATSGSITFTQPVIADVLVIGGGGSGGGQLAGGGGAGALIFMPGVTIASGTYSVTVGTGGAAPGTGTAGANGAASSIGALFIAQGGGGGGTWSSNGAKNGGSGGGASACGASCSGSIASGATYVASNTVNGVGSLGPANSQYVFGNPGGTGSNILSGSTSTNNCLNAGGGGGAGSPGVSYTSGTPATCSSTNQSACGTAGSGGNGVSSVSINSVQYNLASFWGSAYTSKAVSGYIAGGGGGGGYGSYSSTQISGGLGGGGYGYKASTTAAASGQANTGSGGGGASDQGAAGAGGSGLVLIRVQCSCADGTYGPGTGVCTQCPINNYCPSGTSAPTACPTNSISAAGSAACIPSAGKYDLGSSLIAYYPFNSGNMLADVTGKTGSLNNIGSVTSVTGSALSGAMTGWAGGSQNVAYFSQPGGTTDNNAQMQYLSMPVVTVGSSVTICAWYYPTSSNYGTRVWDIGNGAPGNNLIYMQSTGTQVNYVCFPGTVENDVYYNNGWAQNTWQHVCLVVSSTTYTGYHNSTNAGSLTMTSTFAGATYTSGNGWLGRSHFGQALFAGYMDEIRIYNRALTATEVAAIYNFRGDTNTPVMPISCTMSCPGGTVHCSPTGTPVCCGAGQYFVEGTSTACQNCAAGYTGTGATGDCTQCPANTYSTPGSACTPCPANSNSTVGSASCVSSSGYYMLSSASRVPPSPYMTAATVTISGEVFTASASTSFGNVNNEYAYQAFSNTVSPSTSSPNQWTASNQFYSGTGGAYSGSVTTVVNGASIAGEWLQLQTQTGRAYASYALQAGASPDRMPTAFVLAGSNDGITWTQLDSRSGVAAYTAQLMKTFNIPALTLNTYTYIRLIIQTLGSNTYLTIDEFILYPITINACPSNSYSTAGSASCTANTGSYNIDDNLIAYFNFKQDSFYSDNSGKGNSLTSTNGASYQPSYDSSTAPFPGAGAAFLNNQGTSYAGVTINRAYGAAARSFQMNYGAGINLYNYVGTQASPGSGFSFCYWVRLADGATAGTVNSIQYPVIFGFFQDISSNPVPNMIWDDRNSGATDTSQGGTSVYVSSASRGGASAFGRYTRSWTHACTVIQGRSISLYLSCASATCSPTTNTLTADLANINLQVVLFGQGPWSTALYGWLSEIRLYKKALTASEVYAIKSYTGTTASSIIINTCSPSCSAPTPNGHCSPSGTPVCCGAGQYFIEGTSTACQTCAAGTYGDGSATACAQCSAGYYSATAGASSCTACPANSGSPPGSTACTPNPGQYDLGSSLMAYYPFNSGNMLADVSGKLGALTNTGGVTSVASTPNPQNGWAGGSQNSAYLSQPGGTTFSGNTQVQYLSLPAITLPSAVTICAWYYPTGSVLWQRVLDFGNGAPSDNILVAAGSSSSLQSNFYVGTANYNTLNVANAWTTNAWQHMCLVISGSSETVYYNNAAYGPGSQSYTFAGKAYLSDSAWFGRSHFSADPLYTGYFDEIRIYNRALTATEVTAIYNFRGDTSTPVMPIGCTNTTCSANQFPQCTTTGTSICCGTGTYWVPSTSNAGCTSCAAGTYGDGSVTFCTSCAAGFFSAAAGSSVCTACAAGTTSVAGSASCPLASLGCVAGQYYTGSTCTSCPAGRYSSISGTTAIASCSNCSAGTYSTGVAMTAVSTCSSCGAGTYSGAVPSVACTSCGGGTYSTGVAMTAVSACSSCSAGTYSSGAGMTAPCASCPANSYCPAGASQALACPVNSSSPGGAPSCSPNAGTYDLGSDLLAYYPFNNGNALADVCGKTGSLIASASSPTLQSTGPFGAGSYSAAVVAANSQYFSIPTITLPGDFTISAWYYLDSATSVFNNLFTFFGNATANDYLSFYISGNSYAAFSIPNIAFLQIVNSSTIKGTWVHFAVGISNTSLSIWYNGIKSSAPTIGTRSVMTYLYNTIGAKNNIGVSVSNFMTGAFDEFRIYNHLLTTVEVQALYNFRGDTNTPVLPTVCPAGSFCTGGAAQPQVCSAGFYCTSGSSQSQACPAGTYSTGTGMVSTGDCLSCAAGTYSSGISMNAVGACSTCTSGTYSTGAGMTSVATCASCSAGTYSSGSGMTSVAICSSCSAGTYSTGTGMTAAGTCSSCIAGTYSSGAGMTAVATCLTCTSGTYSSGAGMTSVATCASCIAGTYSTGAGMTAAGTCSACTTGTYSSALGLSNSGSCTKCAAGTYSSNTGMTSVATCTACAAGTFSTGLGLSSVTVCTNCAAGTYSATSGSATCAGCTVGTNFASAAAATICVGCGTTCLSGQYISATCTASSNITCATCPSGFVCSNSATTSPTPCGLGTYCPAGSITSPSCLTGYYCPNTTAQLPCPLGTYCGTNSISAIQCVVGNYCPNSSVQIMCDAQMYCPTGSTNQTLCPQDFYCASTSTKAACSSTYYCPAGTVTAAKCPADYYCPDTHTKTLCTLTNYCPEGSIGMNSCAVGSFCPDTHTQTACTTTGSYCIAGLTSEGTCPAGWYCTNSSVKAVCPPNSFCLAGVTGPTACKVCGQGTYTSTYCTSTNDAICTSCVAGVNYAPASNASACTTCGTCATGQYVVSACNVSANITCAVCPLGSYCSSPSSTVVTPCSPGQYCAAGSTSASPCPVGFYCPNASVKIACTGLGYCLSGSANYSVCTNCQPGKYRSILCNATADTVCPTCAAGSTFTNTTNALQCSACNTCPGQFVGTACTTSSDAVCSQCPAGYYCPNPSTQTQCTTPGDYCPSGSTAIKDCAAGYQCTTSSVQIPCNSTYYCPPRTILAALCLLGSYCPNATVQISCTAGNYCPTGSINQTACPAGFECATPSVKVACTSGNYCPASTTSQAACPLGFVCSTTDSKVACTTPNYCPASSTQQLPCPAGFWCTNASVKTACTNNSYCTQGVTVPSTCSVCTSGQYIASVCNATANIVCPPCTNLPSNAAYTGVGSTVANCPWVCNTAYYLNGSQCSSCPQGSWCNANIQNTCPTNSDSVALSSSQNACLCKAGYFGNGSVSGTSPCPICNAGFYCPGGNSNVSVACPTNFSSPTGSSSSADCQCIPGYLRVSNTSCVLCAPGEICISGSRSSCPPNSLAPQGSSNISTCACNPGFYGPNGGTCVQCPANSYCPGGNVVTGCTSNAVSPVQSTNASACYCDRGYQGVSNNPCSPCPPNTWCWTGVLNPCPANTSSAALSSWWLNCTCQPGYTGPDGSACSPCAAGTYKGLQGSANCTACPINNYCPMASVTPTPCPLNNSNSPAGSIGVSQCLCNPGYYGPLCSPCPVTSYCPGGSLAYPCPNLGYTPSVAASSASQCICPANSALNGSGACECVGGYRRVVDSNTSAGWRCDVCSPDAYCVAGTSYPCPAGSTSAAGSSNYSACICAAPTFMTALNPLFGLSGALGTDAYNYPNKAIHVIRDYIFPQTYSGGSVTVASWTVTTTKACTLQALLLSSNDFNFETNKNSAQYYNIIGATQPTVITGAGTYTFQWSSAHGTTTLNPSSSAPLNFGWYDYSNVDCVAGKISATNGSQYVMILGPNNPIWLTTYNGGGPAGTTRGDFAIQINSAIISSPTPALFSCGNCSANQYYSTNTQCGTCQASSVSPVGSASISSCVCVNGTYLVLNASAPGGRQCDACLPGFYCQGGTSTPCPANSYCNGSTITPVTCPALSTAPLYSNSSSACQCGDGYYMSGGICLLCDYATYAAKGTVGACAVCPANSNTTSKGSSTMSQCLCLAGYFGNTTCAICPANSYCPGNKTNYINQCPNSTYSLTGASSVAQCVCPPSSSWLSKLNCTCNNGTYQTTNIGLALAGWQCSACVQGSYCQLGVNMTCPSSFYCPASNAIPIACPAGSFCPASSSTPTVCVAGNFCINGVSNACPVTFYCPANASAPTACPDGSYCLAGSSSPVICPAGKYCTNGTANTCPAGSYCTAGASSPTPCPDGSYCLESSSASVLCPAGQYCKNGTATTCPVGSYCAAAVSSPTACPGGTFCVAGVSQPTQCPGGFYCQNGISNACPAQFFCPPGAANATPCPSGASCAPMASAPATCANGSFCVNGVAMPCPTGSFCTPGSSASQTCPWATYCPASATEPTACPANSNTSGTGSVIATQCRCNAGYNGTNGGQCSQCASNSYCSGGSSSIPCPQGLYTAPGAFDVSQCTCPLNATLVNNQCICIAGRLKTTNPQALIGGWQCDPCPANKACINGSAYVCQAGSFCADGFSAQCPANTYCPTGSSAPTDCPLFSFSSAGASICTCLDGYAFENQLCVRCPPNNYCIGSIQYTCPIGSVSPEGSPSPASCACVAGFFSSSGACIPCLAGSFCPGGSIMSNTAIELCPAGSICPAGVSEPISCASTVGAYCPANSSTLGMCKAGFYCPTAAGPVVACPQGAYCPAGSTAPSFCPTNYYSTKLQLKSVTECTPCTICPVGSTPQTQCTVNSDRVCQTCTGKPQTASYVGSACSWVCNEGYIGPLCTACLPGFWCALGMANQCPLHSSSLQNAKSQNDCTCDPGYTSQGTILGTGPCTQCTAGSICPGGGVIEVTISPTPQTDVSIQLMLVQQPLPIADNLVSLFNGIPAKLAAIQATLPAGVVAYTNRVCRGSYCISCDGSASCVQIVWVGVSQGTGGRFVFNVSSVRADSLVLFVKTAPQMCTPVVNLPPEYQTGTSAVISSISGILSVPIICPTNSLIGSSLPVLGTTPGTRRRSLLENRKRALLQTGSDAVVFSLAVPSNVTVPTQLAVQGANLTIQGYSPIVPAGRQLVVNGSSSNATASYITNSSAPLKCPENSTSPPGTVSTTQCVCLPGYKGNAAAGTPCTPCEAGVFCSGGLIGLCPAHSTAPAMSNSSADCACDPGFYGTGGSCTQCPVNAYCVGGTAQYSNCTANAIAPVQQNNASACYCKAGWVGVANQPCVPCSPGFWCWTGISNQCPMNWTSNASATRMSDCFCADGFQSVSTRDNTGAPSTVMYHRIAFPLFACLLFFLPTAMSDGVVCGPGQFSNDLINCINCTANSYCQGGRLNPCPLYSVSPPGSSSLSQCICQPNSTSINGVCMCNSGFILDRTFQCVLCPANSFCPDQNTIRNCSNNALSLPGQSSPLACNFCPTGYIQNSDTTAPISCRQCLPGYVCPTKNNETMCPAGFKGPPLATDCIPCLTNQYSYNAAPTCSDCPANSESVALSDKIENCNCKNGYYRGGNFQCNTCPAGYSCKANTAQACLKGQYSQTLQSSCLLCSAGKYQDLTGSSTCKTCPQGVTVKKTQYQTEEWPAIQDRSLLENTNNHLYISLKALENTQGYNITSWTFWARTAGCVVTPYIFEGKNMPGSLVFDFTIVKRGTNRTTAASGQQTFQFSDTGTPYLVPKYVLPPPNTLDVKTYFGWVFNGPACIPYDLPSSPNPYFSAISYNVFRAGPFTQGMDVYQWRGVLELGTTWTSNVYTAMQTMWSVQVSGAQTNIITATDFDGSTDIMQCKCPDGTRQISNGQCQKLCPDGQYIAVDTDVDCSPCPQGSYCVGSVKNTCPAGKSSLPGASACSVCESPGGATDIQLYTCGLKNCSQGAMKNLGESTWLGLGRISAEQGSVNGAVSTPWFPGDSIMKMELNPGVDRPYALLQNSIDLATIPVRSNGDKNIAIQFRYQCQGSWNPDWLSVSYSQDSGANFVEVLRIGRQDFGARGAWVTNTTSFFVVVTETPIIVRFEAQMQLFSALLWLGKVDIVSLGAWQYDDILKFRLLTTDAVLVPRTNLTNGYQEPVPATNLIVKNTTMWVDLSTAKLYPGYSYVASLYVSGTGSAFIKLNDVDFYLASNINTKGSYQILFNVTQLPQYFQIQTIGEVIIKAPSLLIRSKIVGCQQCLKDYWCAQETLNQCPTNAISAPGSASQDRCFCKPGYFGLTNGEPYGWSPCTECPLNYFCPGGNNVTVCPNGTYTLSKGSTSCIPCNVDDYCALGKTSMCPGHSTSPISSWDVTQCICDPGYYGIAPDCKPCERGFYCFNGIKTACTEHAVSPELSSNYTQCYCDRGWEGVENAECQPCTEASYCWTGIKTKCPTNMWSPKFSSYQANCTCDYGTYPVQAACSLCSAGTYKSSRGVGVCSTCGAGKYSTSNGASSSDECVGCAPGTYSISVGQYQCQACQAGYYASGLASSTCKTCWAGSYSVSGSSACSLCQNGTASAVVAAPDRSTCKPCQLGEWSYANSTSCTLCGACPYWEFPPAIHLHVVGTFTTVFSSTNQNYRFAINNIDGTVFMAMGTSIYKIDLTSGIVANNTVSVQGPPAAVRWWFASISASVLGNYLYVIQNQDTYRVDLDMGAYDILYPSKLATCVLEDSTNPAVLLWIVQPTMIRKVDPTAAFDIASYPISGANYVCVNPMDPATLYVTGTFGLKAMDKDSGVFRTITTGTAYTVCQITPDGTWVILSAATLKKTIAYPLGNGASGNIMAGALVTGILVTNTHIVLGANGAGVRNVSYEAADSRNCMPGQFGPFAAMQSPDSCNLCASGNLCPGGANVTACAPGTYSVQTGMREQAQCSICPAGSYCEGGQCDPQAPGDCSIDPVTGVCSGQDCIFGDHVLTCPSGSFSSGTGLFKRSMCPLCAGGFYCPTPLTMLPCPNNTWSDDGASDLGQCKCVAGYRCTITKVVHAEVVLQMSKSVFDSSTAIQSRYIAAIAAAAGVDASRVSIQGTYTISNPAPMGRRLLAIRRSGAWNYKAIEIHTLIHESQMVQLADLDSHLINQGLPPHTSVKMSLHEEVVQSYRHTDGWL